MVKKACVFVTAAELAGVTNTHMSARHLLGQHAGGWLSTLRDVKDKVQSVTPAIPKLLPSAMVELTVMNRASKHHAVNNTTPATSGKVPATKDEGRAIQNENNGCIHNVRTPDSNSSHTEDKHHDVCDRQTTPGSNELSNELLTKLRVGDLAISNHVYDQNSVAAAEFAANQSTVFCEQVCQVPAGNSVDISHGVSSVETSPFHAEQNLPFTEHEAQHCNETTSQPGSVSRPMEVRTFSADVSDSPQIVFSSFRKKTKPIKQGIYYVVVFTVLYYIAFM